MADKIVAQPRSRNNSNNGAIEDNIRFWPAPAAMGRDELNDIYYACAQSENFELAAIYADALLSETTSLKEEE